MVLTSIISSISSPNMLGTFGSDEIFLAVIGFSWATFLWEEYLAYRQRKVVRETTEVPQELEDVLDKETFDKARDYSIDKSNFSLIESCFSQVLSTGIMVYQGFPYLWNLSGNILSALGGSGEILQTVLFVAVGNTFSTLISLPWSTYFTFKIEQKHGFNNQTLSFYFFDKLKKFAVSQIIFAPVITTLVVIIKAGGKYFFFYLWLFTCLLMLFFMTIYPDFIAPIFDKYEPLREGELKTRIELLAKRVEFPLKKLYVVEGSKRSAHSNAYFYGFFNNKRIVLYDTLLHGYIQPKEGEANRETGCNDDEVLAVLGHELGHWKLNHVLKGIIISQVNIGLIFAVFSLLHDAAPLYEAFGFTTKPSFIGLVIVMQFVFAPYNEILTLLMNMFSRHNEFEADQFGAKLGFASHLKSGLLKLNKDNLSFPVHDHLFSAWHHSHPPLLARLRELSVKED